MIQTICFAWAAACLWVFPVRVQVRCVADLETGAWASFAFAGKSKLVFLLGKPSSRKRSAQERHDCAVCVLQGAAKFLRRKSTRLRLVVRVALPDAAQTALLCGCFWSLASFVPGVNRLSVHPEYGALRRRVTITGMLEAHLGHILYAAVDILWRLIRQKGWNRWKKGPLKAL